MTTSAHAQRVEESVTLWGIRREGQDPPLQGKSAGAYGIRADRNTAPTVSDEADSFFDSLKILPAAKPAGRIFSLSKNFQTTRVSGIIEETGV